MNFLQRTIKVGKSKVVNNFLNLGSIQIADMLLPLITVPYIVRIIGFEKVGVIAFATAVVSYLNILINYGFNLTATKQISQNNLNKSVINKIFFSVSWTKFILILLSSIIITIFFFIPKFRSEYLIYILLFGNIVFQNLIPTWFLQGMQDLNFSTKITLLFKVISTILVFFLVTKMSDYWIIVALNLVSSFLSFLSIAFYILKKYELRYLKFNYKIVLSELNAGKFIFLSQLKISLFNNFNILILGLLLSDKAVGVFSSADKIIKLISSIQIPIVSALFPYFAKSLKENFLDGVRKLKKTTLYGSMLYGFIIIITYFLAPLLTKILFGNYIDEISLLIRLMLLIPLFVYMNNMYGTQLLLNVNQDKVFLKNIFIAALVNVSFIVPLTYFFNIYGTALSIVLTEFILFYLMRRSAHIYIKIQNEN